MAYSRLAVINSQISEGWEARLTTNARIYYVNHHSQTSHWIPPGDNWEAGDAKLPYGWEEGEDTQGKAYFINHVDKSTVRSDPREEEDYLEPPAPREVELYRDPQMGFGFVAGSEKPVIVRFVTEGGPSVDKLLPGDQIIKINGKDVKKSPREYVIDLVRSCRESITLTVCQPYIDNSERKSALLTAAKKAKLKNHPSRVRFAESVTVNGAPVVTPSTNESYIPFMPNVLKVFLENGQTKSFKYDNKTTVKDVLNSLQEKLNIDCIEHFGLVLENTKASAHAKMSVLQERELLAEIAANPVSQHLKCLFRVVYITKEITDMAESQPQVLDYFYTQCCNDVVSERFAPELKYEMALKLAALQIYQYSLSCSITGKISLKALEKECGMEKFVPASLLGGMKSKDLRKMLNHYLKEIQSSGSPHKPTEQQAKLNYLKLVTELRCCGGRSFVATWVEKRVESMIHVGPKLGISHVVNIRQNTWTAVADFHEVECLDVSKETDMMQRVVVRLKNKDMSEMTLSMLNEDMHDFIALVEGYYRLLVGIGCTLQQDEPEESDDHDNVPQYHAEHTVIAAPWSYASEGGDKTDTETTTQGSQTTKCVIDLSTGPPCYTEKPDLVNLNAEDVTSETESVTTEKQEVASQSSETSLSLPTEPPPQQASAEVNTLTAHSSIEAILDKCDNESSVDELRAASPASPELDKSWPPVDSNANDIDSHLGIKEPLVFPGEDTTQGRGSPGGDRLAAEVNSITDEHQADESDALIRHDSLSDIGSESTTTSYDTEEKPLLSQHISSKQEVVYEQEVGELRDLVPSESDTDSMSTPTDSPLKQRLGTLALSPPPLFQSDKGKAASPQSFGLHSPDSLHMTEQQLQAIAQSFGLTSPDQLPDELLHPGYNPRLFCDGGIYLDPDIIDLSQEPYLTLIPPPKTPDAENLIDFSCSDVNPPPPGFGDETRPAGAGSQLVEGDEVVALVSDLPMSIREEIDRIVQNDQELGTQLAAIDALMMADAVRHSDGKESGVESETDSGNETITSDGLDRSVTPVKDTQASQRPSSLLTSRALYDFSVSSAEGSEISLPIDSDIDALIAKLIVPPPPVDTPVNQDYTFAPPPDPATPSEELTQETALISANIGGAAVTSGSTFQDTDDDVFPPPPLPEDVGVASPDDPFLDISGYVIPPPPKSDSMEKFNINDIPIVPPVDSELSVDEEVVVTTSQAHGGDVISYDSSFQDEDNLENGPGLSGSPGISNLIKHLQAKAEMHPVSPVNHSSRVNSEQLPNGKLISGPSKTKGESVEHQKDIAAKPSAALHKTQAQTEMAAKGDSSSSLTSSEHQTITVASPCSPKVNRNHVLSTFQPAKSNGAVEMRQKGVSLSEGSSPVHVSQMVKNFQSISGTKRQRLPPPPPPRRGSSYSGSTESCNSSGSENSASNSGHSNISDKCAIEQIKQSFERRSSQLAINASTCDTQKTDSKPHGTIQTKILDLERLFKTKKGLDSICSGDNKSDSSAAFDDSGSDVSITSAHSWNGNSSHMPSKGHVKEMADLVFRRTNSANECSTELSLPPRRPLRQQTSLPLEFNEMTVSNGEGRRSSVSSLGSPLGRNSQGANGAKEVSPSCQGAPRSSSVPVSPHRVTPVGSTLPVIRSRKLQRPLAPPPPPKRTHSASREPTCEGKKPEPVKPAEEPEVSFQSHTLPRYFRHSSAPTGDSKQKDKKSPKKTTFSLSEPPTGAGADLANLFNHSEVPDLVSPPTQREVTFSTFRGSGDDPPVRSPPWKKASTALDNYIETAKDSRANGNTKDSTDMSGGDRTANEVGGPGAESVTESPTGCAERVISIQSKAYSTALPTAFIEVRRDVHVLIQALQEMDARIKKEQRQVSVDEFKSCKDTLVSESRQFVTDSKLLVSSATQSKEKLVNKMGISVHTLAKIVHHCQRTTATLTSVSRGHELVSRVKDVASAYQSTVVAANAAVGRPLHDASMKVLMRQATNLAAVLSSLMRTLKTIDNR